MWAASDSRNHATMWWGIFPSLSPQVQFIKQFFCLSPSRLDRLSTLDSREEEGIFQGKQTILKFEVLGLSPRQKGIYLTSNIRTDQGHAWVESRTVKPWRKNHICIHPCMQACILPATAQSNAECVHTEYAREVMKIYMHWNTCSAFNYSIPIYMPPF